ncbi:hypothetical protein EVAR_31298_1 [Eumeta japonica]|uniref:Uncharacterized protein n=1 Tax=Eumeta variegata TaxID=151549 RepID=A0A4C1VR64_EUMVA|nr:hypothetical protein EVAR_31298_1 [Eumeta japonica]
MPAANVNISSCLVLNNTKNWKFLRSDFFAHGISVSNAFMLNAAPDERSGTGRAEFRTKRAPTRRPFRSLSRRVRSREPCGHPGERPRSERQNENDVLKFA